MGDYEALLRDAEDSISRLRQGVSAWIGKELKAREELWARAERAEAELEQAKKRLGESWPVARDRAEKAEAQLAEQLKANEVLRTKIVGANEFADSVREELYTCRRECADTRARLYALCEAVKAAGFKISADDLERAARAPQEQQQPAPMTLEEAERRVQARLPGTGITIKTDEIWVYRDDLSGHYSIVKIPLACSPPVALAMAVAAVEAGYPLPQTGRECGESEEGEL